MLKNNKVNNAVILAAGRGKRLNELTKITPKPLLKNKNGVPIIEDIIIKLKEKNINEIFVVVGYKWKLFRYLENKYDLKIIRNREWRTTNNPSSINAVINKMKNTLIINGDSIMNKNIIRDSFPCSLTYGEKNKNINEWIIEIDENGNVIDFNKNGIDKQGFYQREITFVTEELVDKIKWTLIDFNVNEYFEYLLIQTARNFGIDFKIHEIEKNLIEDIDNIGQFRKHMDPQYIKFIDKK